MTSFKNQNHVSNYFRQQPMAIFARTKSDRVTQLEKLDRLPADDDPWLVAMIKELTDSENDQDT